MGEARGSTIMRPPRLVGALLLWPSVCSTLVTGLSTTVFFFGHLDSIYTSVIIRAIGFAALPGLGLGGFVGVMFAMVMGGGPHGDVPMILVVPPSIAVNLWLYYRIFQGLFWVRRRFYAWWRRSGR